MSYPPPNEPQQPGPGGGFGPPQGFGPSEPAGPPGSPPGGYGYPGPPGNPPGGYGYPGPPGTPPGGYGPGGPGGYGPGGPGGYGPGGPGSYPPPPNGGGNGPNKAAITVIAVVLGIAVAIGVVLLVSGGDDGDKDRANVSASSSPSPKESDEPDPTPTSIPSLDLPSTVPTQPSEPSVAPTVIPYVVLPPGTCFNHPALNSDAKGIDRRSCNESHDAEVISNRKVSGDFATDTAIQQAALALCEKDARTRLQKMPQDGTVYYPFALYPLKSTYDFQGKDTVSCAMTLSNTKDGKQLAAPLPGG
ncbi:hypothetical protein QNO07_11915 [Streptomyces sp. 549]|uniref:hypothetical protein n=1 Tax=Streptomyces sp. 549 TaxID=3049076 RepID=UPI0024C30367|nr:hypothetical protein [Streptomyces sp. 549]MDK1474113.1 hypothetical protein [Streptomyces sp. 549]